MKTNRAGRSRRDRRDRPGDEDLLTGSIYERACPQCGKLFLCFNVTEWVYRRGDTRVFCSWTCYREDQRGVPPHGAAAGTLPKTPKKNNTRFNQEQAREQTRQIIAMKAEGKTNEECAQALHLTTFQVANRLQTFGKELGWVPWTKTQAAMAAAEAKRARRKIREYKKPATGGE